MADVSKVNVNSTDYNIKDSNAMHKGVDRVTAGQLSGSTLGTRATAEGYDITASGLNSHGEGSGTTAEGENSHAEGNWTFATGFASHTEGEATHATQSYSHAEGYYSTASGNSSHAEGYYNTASGNFSHAEGFYSTASGNSSHAEGYQTKASSAYQHVEGKYNVEDANGTYAHIIGGGTANNARKNIFTVDWNGVARDGTQNRLMPFKAVSEAEYAALSQAEKTNGTAYFRYEASGIMRQIQDDGSATSLTSGALPTGQTITSYLNSNFHVMQITVPSSSGQTTTVPLPSGWTRNNCIIEQVYILKFNGSNVYFSDTLASEGITFVFTGDALTAITSASAKTGWFGDTANVILRRIVQ